MAKHAFFISGTDTGVGKTLVCAALLHAANRRGLRSLGLKPVAAGCRPTAEGPRNDDALLLAEYASEKLAYAQINPVALAAPVAPHLAAAREGKSLSVARLLGYCRGAMLQPSDLCLVEGAGGWRVPLNAREDLADLAIALRLPVILVVAMRLGCLNHALLSAAAIARDGLPLAGWVANVLEPDMPMLAENIATLAQRLGAPLLGQIPHLGGGLITKSEIERAAMALDISKLVDCPGD